MMACGGPHGCGHWCLQRVGTNVLLKRKRLTNLTADPLNSVNAEINPEQRHPLTFTFLKAVAHHLCLTPKTLPKYLVTLVNSDNEHSCIRCSEPITPKRGTNRATQFMPQYRLPRFLNSSPLPKSAVSYV